MAAPFSAASQQVEPLPVLLIQHRWLLLRRPGFSDPQLLHNKRVQLGLVVSGLHRLLIRPGETLSLWRRLGRPTADRGFLPGVQLSQGRVSMGGGAASAGLPI